MERAEPVGEPEFSEPLVCQFCDAPAEAACERCGTLYCAAHGDATCDACAEPASGLPSRAVFYSTVGVLVIGVIAGLALLITMPRLPGERPPTDAAPPAATGQPAVQGGTQSPAGAAAGGDGATVVPAGTPAGERYRIRAGDTLLAIATQYGTTVDAIRAANPGINESALQIDQEIVIPAR